MNHFLSSQNHLFQLARTGYRLPASMAESAPPILDKLYPILALILAVLFVFLSQIGGGLIAVLLLLMLTVVEQGNMPTIDEPETLVKLVTPDTALDTAIFLIFAFGPIFIILWAWLIMFEKRSLWTVGLERGAAVWHYLRGLLVGFVMFAAAVGISAAFGFMAFESGEPSKQGVTALGGVIIVLFGWVVQGAAEEALTRGWLLPVIGSRYNVIAGIILSSSLFGFLHLLNPSISYIAMLNLFLFGVFTCLYALYEKGLWGVFSIHSVWNWAQGNVFGLEVSGNPQAGGTLFNLMETGPDVVTGGAFGPEGGLAVTAVLLVSCGIVWFMGQRQKED